MFFDLSSRCSKLKPEPSRKKAPKKATGFQVQQMGTQSAKEPSTFRKNCVFQAAGVIWCGRLGCVAMWIIDMSLHLLLTSTFTTIIATPI